MSMDSDSSNRCRRCGTPTELDGSGSGMCPECAIISAQESIDARPAPVMHGSKAADKTRRSAVLVAVLATVLFAVSAWLIPPILVQAEAESPPRVGVLETDEVGDECIENLDILLIHLQETGEFDDEIVCPATEIEYVVEMQGEQVVRVLCPNPGVHELTALYVAASDTVPTAEGGEE